MDVDTDPMVLVKEYQEDRDLESVEKLDRSCELGSRKGISLTDMMGDPLYTIRLYERRIMLVSLMVYACMQLVNIHVDYLAKDMIYIEDSKTYTYT